MSTGLVIGKFMPPTMGHKYLIDFAANFTGRDTTLLVCTRKDEPISGQMRYAALAEHFGGKIRVVHFENDLPEAPDGIPDFWDRWRTGIQEATGEERFSHVFASEGYGKRLAEEMGGGFVPVNIGRRTVQISATIIRDSVLDNWGYILPEFRRHYVIRVAVVGPESCGKTELCRDLAKYFETEWCPEWARAYLEADGNRYPVNDDYRLIATAHACAEDALARQATKVLISDTDAVCTKVAARVLNDFEDEIVNNYAKHRHYDLRLVMGDDVPYAPDPLRYGITARQFNTAEFEAEYHALGLPFITVRGSWEQRFQTAAMAIRKLMRDADAMRRSAA